MNFRLRIAFAVLWLCSVNALSAQIGLSLPFINGAAPGTNKSLSVRVSNFDSIVSMQYVIRWNPAVLEYTNIDLFNLPGLSIQNFNAQRALDSGFVRLLWEGPNSFPGVSLLNDVSIFRLKFKVIGPDTSSTFIRFTEITNAFPATDFEIVKVIRPDSTLAAFNELQCNLVHGFVAVGYTVATTSPDNDPLALSLSPNPFSENTRAEFYLEQTADIQVVIADAAGRILFQEDLPQLPAGKQGVNINKAVFPAKGAYFLTIRTGSQTSSRTLICN